jgi:hypothetical protein
MKIIALALIAPSTMSLSAHTLCTSKGFYYHELFTFIFSNRVRAFFFERQEYAVLKKPGPVMTPVCHSLCLFLWNSSRATCYRNVQWKNLISQLRSIYWNKKILFPHLHMFFFMFVFDFCSHTLYIGSIW